MRLSKRAERIQPSATLAVDKRAKELCDQGVDVIGFGAGAPDFDTPDHIKEAAKRALDAGDTKYTPVGGTKALREAAATWLSEAWGYSVKPDEVVASCGAKHSLANLFLALLDDGDEVVVPAPYWVSYPEMVRLAGGAAVVVPTRAEDGFALRPDDLARAITPRTRAVILNNPSNPVGSVWSQAQVDPIAKLCVERDLLMVSDDIYRSLVYGVEPGHVSKLGPEAQRLTILIDGVSKTYSMTGFRVGFCAGVRPIIAAIEKIQSQTTSNPTSIAQAAAVEAITGPQDEAEKMRLEFDRRRKRMVELLRAIPGVKLVEPRGAFYAFPDLSAIEPDDMALAARLLEEQKLAVVPGSPFGAPGHVRLSYATSMEKIEEGLHRLRAGLGVDS